MALKYLPLFCLIFSNVVFAADSGPKDDPEIRAQRASLLFGGMGYSDSGGSEGDFGFGLLSTHMALTKNEPGNWEGGGYVYFFPNSQAWTSIYLYAGYEFTSNKRMAAGLLVGMSAMNAPSTNTTQPGFTGGGQMSYEFPLTDGLVLVPRLAFILNTLSIPTPFSLLSLEIRFAHPRH